MNASRMWHLIAELVSTYAQEGDLDRAMECLTQALTSEPMWIPNALFDPRTELLRDRDDFRQLTTLPSEDGPAHFNAAVVAMEYGQLDAAISLLTRTFELAAEDGSLPFLIEALKEEEAVQPYLNHSQISGLLERYAG